MLLLVNMFIINLAIIFSEWLGAAFMILGADSAILGVVILSSRANTPKPQSQLMWRWCRVSLALVIAGSASFRSITCDVHYMFDGDADQDTVVAQAWISVLNLIIVTIVCVPCWVRSYPPSPFTRNAVGCLGLIWVTSLSWVSRKMHGWCSHSWVSEALYATATGVTLAGAVASSSWVVLLTMRKLKELESVTQRSSDIFSRAKKALMLSFVLFCLVFVSRFLGIAVDIFERILAPILSALTLSMFVFGTLLAATQGAAIMRKPAAQLANNAENAQGMWKAETLWASRTLYRESWAAFGVLSTTIFHVTVRLTLYVLSPYGPMERELISANFRMTTDILVFAVDAIANAVSIALLSGILIQDPHPSSALPQPPPVGVATNLPNASDPDRSAKVKELAGRGFELGHLLSFYERLGPEGDIMQHFDSSRSTTRDVVRQAIIPSSRTGDGGRALSSVWNGSQQKLAQTMVSHSWSNLFSHLVAAIVAHALGLSMYGDVAENNGKEQKINVAELLSSKVGRSRLRKTLLRKGTLTNTYWVCSISVNQHSCICATPPTSELDSVTGNPYPPCDCKEAKYFNDAGAKCELDKFDEMMKVLNDERTKSSDFRLLVALDNHFDLFSRAWCIAELVEAAKSEIPTDLCVHSRQSFFRHRRWLSDLQIQNCRATREEDKKMILDKVADKKQFNAFLQWSIFGTEGLFNRWMDGADRLSAVAPIIEAILQEGDQTA